MVASAAAMDASKYVRYTPEQVEALERLYYECPKPSSLRRQQLVRECPALANVDPKQIKVWFQNRRCREKQRKESSRLQALNRKLTAMNKLLMEENDRLQKQVSQLVYDHGRHGVAAAGMMRRVPAFPPQAAAAAGHQLATATDTSCESVVTSGHHHQQQQHNVVQPPPRDASPAGLMSIAEETLTEFLSKATGTAVEWLQMPGMKVTTICSSSSPTSQLQKLDLISVVVVCSLVRIPLESSPSRMAAPASPRELAASSAWSPLRLPKYSRIGRCGCAIAGPWMW
jgi:homeobox-leucine zipper protein